METEKRFNLDNLPKIPEAEKLFTIAPKLIERGTVLKSLIYQDSGCEISLLVLSPSAKIKSHQHIDDKECYYLIKDRVAKMCTKGNYHELENPSDSEWMFVLSLKYKD